MKAYQFYGWEAAHVRDSLGLTPCDYYDLLSDSWCAETCAPRMRKDWTIENRTLSQCSITAFLIQDIYGGKVYGVPLGDGNYHCFNDVDGCVFDLTSEQFGDTRLDYSNCPEQDRAVHFAKAEKKERYELLKERLFARRPALVPITMAHAERYGAIYAESDAVIHVRELLETKTAYGLEYVMDGKVVGFLLGTSMLFHYGRTFEINDLAVDPDYQGRGIASALLERCKADMKARGIVGLHLITSADGFLPAFYERHGFGREHEVILMGMEM